MTSLALLILISVLVLLSTLRLMFFTVVVDKSSMSPTLNPGDRVLVLRYWPFYHLRHQQIVVFTSGQQETSGKRVASDQLFIKRLVGLPDDIIQLPYPTDHEIRTWRVPTKHIFVVGDNINLSMDSRVWGPIPTSRIKGVVIRTLPLNMGRAVEASRMAQGLKRLHRVGLDSGAMAPLFALETLDGRVLTTESFRDQATTFFIFLPSSVSANALAPLKADAAMAMQRARSQLVLVSAGDKAATLSFLQQYPMPWTTLLAPLKSNPFVHDYQVIGFPTCCQIDQLGRIQKMGFTADHTVWRSLLLSCGYIDEQPTSSDTVPAPQPETDAFGQPYFIHELADLDRVSMATFFGEDIALFDTLAATHNHQSLIQEGAEVITYRSEGRLVAYITYMVLLNKKECLMISLQTHPNYRNGVVLAKLLAKIAERLAMYEPNLLHEATIRGTVHPQNLPSIRLHRRLGFQAENKDDVIIFYVQVPTLLEKLGRYVKASPVLSLAQDQ